jgi:hypothetical protein
VLKLQMSETILDFCLLVGVECGGLLLLLLLERWLLKRGSHVLTSVLVLDVLRLAALRLVLELLLLMLLLQS